MRKQMLCMMLASAMLAGCGDSADTLPAIDNGAPARVSSATFQAGDSIPLPAGGEWVEVADINNDTSRDLVVGLSDRVVVLRGNGDGSFADPQQISALPGHVIEVADLNADGFLDVVASSLDAPNFQVLPGNGDGTFDPAVELLGGGDINEVHALDLDGDGDLDLAVSVPTIDRVQTFLNSGDFNFGAGPEANVAGPSGMAVADYNGDGRSDLAVGTEDPDGVQVLLNLANGFQLAGERPTASRSFSAAAGDFNADGRADLATIELDDILSAHFGDGSGGLSEQVVTLPTGQESFQVVTGNLNGDNHSDVVVGTLSSGQIEVYIANAQGGFDQRPTLSSPDNVSVTTGDVNGDGYADIIAVTRTPSVNVFLGQP
jgi:hypothetical protein